MNEFSNEHNKGKNLNWHEADQLAIYKHSRPLYQVLFLFVKTLL